MKGEPFSDEERRRRIRRNTVLLALVALAIYAGFIASGIVKSLG